MKYYTGVGTRQVDPCSELYWLMVSIGKKLARLGYTLRSGAADGCDMAFEEGCNEVGGAREIYIPWNGFNNRWADKENGVYNFVGLPSQEIAAKIHPAWDKLSIPVKKLHSRNIHQVLGQSLDTPSNFLICYAQVDKQDVPKGGTRTAWMCAQNNKIPCFNLYHKKDLTRIENWLES